MKVRFKQTSTRRRFGSRGLNLKDGDTAEVSHELVEHLLRHWPDNFETVQLDLSRLPPPLHEPLKLSELSIVTVYHNMDILQTSLLSYLPEEVDLIKVDNSEGRWKSLARALNYGVGKARNDLVICPHQDTRFDVGWFGDFIQQEARLKDWGVLGITGFDVDRRLYWGSDYSVPRRIAFLDECCLILNRKNGLLFDEETFRSWHRYGIDFCLQCREAGLGVYLVTGLAHHDCYPDIHPKEWWEQHKVAHRLLGEKWQNKFGWLLPAVIN